LAALFYAEENYRHLAAWRVYSARIGLDIRPLNFRDYLPKPVPEEKNFAGTPLMKRLGIKGRSDEALRARLQTYAPSMYLADLTKRTPADLEGAVAFLEKNHGTLTRTHSSVGLTVLEAMKGVEDSINELRTASQRQEAQFECAGEDPWSLPLPDFIAMRTLSQILSIRISAFLESKQPEEAMKDVVVIHRIMEAMKSNNTLVTAMVRVAIGGIESACFWEGWSRRTWTRTDYERFQTYYESVNFVDGVHKAFQGGERAGVHYLALNYPASKLGEVFSGGITRGKSWKDDLLAQGYELGFLLAPNGWRYAALQRYDSLMVDALSALDSAHRRVDLAASSAVGTRVLESISRDPRNVLVNLAIPNFPKALIRMVHIQTLTHLSILVCGLERFKIDTGAYPSALEQLTPKYVTTLPGEVVNSESFKYSTQAQGGFKLYSIGSDGKDDDGNSGSTIENGDWPWMHATTE